jgi:lysophospholipase L1-like esterase
MWWLTALAVVVVAAATVSLYLLQPPGEAIAADDLSSDAPSSEPTQSPGPISTPTAISTPEPQPTFPPDEVDKKWPDNPPWDACPAPIWPGEPNSGTPGDGRRVLVLGDSLTRDSQEPMTKYLAESGWTPTFRCWGSKRLDWGLDQVKRAKQLNQLPEYVIVALGTNDISWEQPATTERRVNTMLDRLGPDRQVLWVDLDIAYSTFSMTRADWFNKMIRQVAKDRSNLKVVPWEKIARQENAARFDGIHYGTSGYKLRARELTDALDKHARSLAQKSPSPSPEVS